MSTRKIMLAIGVAAIASAACGQAYVDDPSEVGTANFSLATGSCPVTSEIQSIDWTVEHTYTRAVVRRTISRAEIDNHCAGITTELVALQLRSGSYESIVEAKDARGVVINDADAAYSTFGVRKGQRTPVSATIRAATGTATANGSWTVDNASFDGGAVGAGRGCCTPNITECSSESQVGCKRATNNGICTGWQDPCPY